MKIVSDTHTQHVLSEDGTITKIPPGQPFDCEREPALEKIAAGSARPFDASDESTDADLDDAERLEKIGEAVMSLDEKNVALWDRHGSPLVAVLADRCGFKVTAGERDRVWAELSE